MKLSSTWHWASTMFDALSPAGALAAGSLGRFLPLPDGTPSAPASTSAPDQAGAHEPNGRETKRNALYLTEYERAVSRASIARAIAEERIRIAEREDRPIPDEPHAVWRPRPVLKKAG